MFQTLVNLQSFPVVTENVGGQRQGQLGRPVSGNAPLNPLWRQVPSILAQIEQGTFAVLFDIDRTAVIRPSSVVNLHALDQSICRDGKGDSMLHRACPGCKRRAEEKAAAGERRRWRAYFLLLVQPVRDRVTGKRTFHEKMPERVANHP